MIEILCFIAGVILGFIVTEIYLHWRYRVGITNQQHDRGRIWH